MKTNILGPLPATSAQLQGIQSRQTRVLLETKRDMEEASISLILWGGVLKYV